MLDLTPALRVYAHLRLARLATLNAAVEQETQLLRLVRRAVDTRFGQAHGFAGIRTVAEYQERVPLRRYDDFWRDWWQPQFPRLTNVTWPGTIPLFALSSGTSSASTKYIPCSPAMTRANSRAGLDLLSHHLAARPQSRVFGGLNLMLGGSTDLSELAPGIHAGDLSGIAATRLPRWARGRAFPPLEVALMSDWEQKVARMAELAAGADIRLLAGTPSWLLILLAEQARHAGLAAGAGLARLYPRLELLVHGGVDFAPYRARFEALIEGTHAELREVYPASEGFIALADRGPGQGLRLMIDNGLFFEFVPLDELDAPNPTRHWLGNVELGVTYALVLSSCAGLWSYVVGDSVRLLTRRPPRLLMTGRTSAMLSAFGEHLLGAEIEQAVAVAAAAIGAAVTDYSVGARFPEGAEQRGGHHYLIEFAPPMPEATALARFAQVLDQRLGTLNEDYRAHRAGGFGLRPPEIAAVPPGTFAAWMKHRGKLGGQNKVPRVITDPVLWSELQAQGDKTSPA